MSELPRNRRFKRKSGKSSPDSTSGYPAARRSQGLKRHQNVTKPQKPDQFDRRRGENRGEKRQGGTGLIWGQHSVRAALLNPRRTIHDFWASESALGRLDLPKGATLPARSHVLEPRQLDQMLSPGSAHQGLILKAAPLEWPELPKISQEADEDGLILVLDQITDPHNVGAMLRLASAFGVDALVMQTRRAPPLSGALAKVAVGCLETVPICLVTNIANTLEQLKLDNWMVTGLAGEAKFNLAQAVSGGGRQVLVMGAEGPGLRPRVAKSCDQLARIPMQSQNRSGQAESLNVATAAAIALYESRRS